MVSDPAGHHIKSEVGNVAFSPDGRRLASGGADGKVRLWRVATGQLVLVPEGHSGGSVVSVAFSPDGRLLASGADDGEVCLWDLAAGRLAIARHGYVGGMASVALSPDVRLLASCGRDGTVRLWEPGRLEPVSQLRVGAPVTALSWGPAGIAVAGSEGIMLLAVIDRK